MIFEWDPKKAAKNFVKHKIDFSESTSIFNDIHILSMLDEDHSENEERMLSLGLMGDGKLVTMSHTLEIVGNSEKVRIISVRKATKNETKQYYGRIKK